MLDQQTLNTLIIGDPSAGWCKEIQRWLAPQHVCTVANTTDEIDLSQITVLLGAPMELAQLIPQCPQLKWAQSTWAGVDAISHFASDSLSVTALKGVFGQSMTEYVFGWLLALERNILNHAQATGWQPIEDSSTAGKTMGIMGTGSIGSALPSIARQLGITCRGLNSDGRSIAGFDHVYASDDRLSFAQGLDYLISILPSTPATDHIIDADLLQRLNHNAIVINVGRGNAVRARDLLGALNRNVRYAVLDVFEEEPLPRDHPFWQKSNVFITSHTAAVTASNAVVALFKENFERFSRGKTLLYKVDPLRGY